jgi:excisionase family DNA binding protein
MEMFSTREVAALLGVSDQTVRTLIARGVLPGERLSDTSWYSIRKDRLIEYAEKRGVSLDWSRLNK